KGFEAGLKHLKKEEGIKLRDLKNDQTRRHTIAQLKYILYEREFKNNIKGLLDVVFGRLPLIFSEKTIYEYGYWNALVHTIDEVCEKAGINENELKGEHTKQQNCNKT